MRSRPIWTDLTEEDQFETRRTDLRARDHSANSLALNHASFGMRREVPVRSKKSDKLLLFILNVLNMQRKLRAIFLPPKMPIFSRI